MSRSDDLNRVEHHAEAMLRLIDRGVEPNPTEAEAMKLLALAAIARELNELKVVIRDRPLGPLGV